MKPLMRVLSLLETTLPVVLINRLWSLKWILSLAVAVWVSALYVAYTSHQTRQQTALLEELKQQQYELEMEWEALRLEQGALAEHSRIERIAREKLNMRSVSASSEVVVNDRENP